jgi:hypothetical protein
VLTKDETRILSWSRDNTLRLWAATWPKGNLLEIACVLLPVEDHGASDASNSQKGRTTWNRIKKLADDFLPQARILHPWPHARFAVKHPRWEPSALIGYARSIMV